jgi:hypothetical protein
MAGDQIPKASDNEGAWGFNRKDAARIARVVKRVEAQYYNTPAERGRYPVGAPGSSLVPLAITSNVTAGTEAAPTSFNATIMVPTGTTNGWTTTGGTAITGYNRAPGTSFSASGGSHKTGWGITLQGVVYLVAADC